jgi:hypothetical protein
LHTGGAVARGRPTFPNLCEIDNPDCTIFDTLAAVCLGILGVSAPECNHILVPNKRTPAFQISYDSGSAPSGQRKVHGCRFTVRFGLRLVEVRVTI